jgi:hypothetical protein
LAVPHVYEHVTSTPTSDFTTKQLRSSKYDSVAEPSRYCGATGQGSHCGAENGVER